MTSPYKSTLSIAWALSLISALIVLRFRKIFLQHKEIALASLPPARSGIRRRHRQTADIGGRRKCLVAGEEAEKHENENQG